LTLPEPSTGPTIVLFDVIADKDYADKLVFTLPAPSNGPTIVLLDVNAVNV